MDEDEHGTLALEAKMEEESKTRPLASPPRPPVLTSPFQSCAAFDSRVKVARVVREVVEFIQDQKRHAEKDYDTLKVGAEKIFKREDGGWKNCKEELNSIAIRLEYHVNIKFDRQHQSQGDLGEKLVLAACRGVTTSPGADGSLNDTFRQWNASVSDIHWSDTAIGTDTVTGDWTKTQLLYCGLLIIFYYNINDTADSLCKEVYAHNAKKLDPVALEVLFHNDERALSTCLADAFKDVCCGLHDRLKRHVSASILKDRRSREGPGRECFDATDIYIFSAAMRKSFKDPRLYSVDALHREKMMAAWEGLGRRIHTAGKVYVLKSEFDNLIKKATEKVNTMLREIGDIALTTKSAAKADITLAVGGEFVNTVLKLAPPHTILAKAGKPKTASKAELKERFANGVAQYLWNTRCKMVRSNYLVIQEEGLVGVGGFRAAVAAKCLEHTQNQFEQIQKHLNKIKEEAATPCASSMSVE